jgi:hypothetical protein
MEFCGPMVVLSSQGSPRIHFSDSETIASTNGSATLSATRIRSEADHTCPAPKKHPGAMAAAAFSGSASGSTMAGPFPPSSSSLGLSPQREAISLPVALLPVMAMAWVPGLTTSSSPTSAPCPMTRLRTPSGRPASASKRMRVTAVTAAVGAGVHTTVLP